MHKIEFTDQELVLISIVFASYMNQQPLNRVGMIRELFDKIQPAVCRILSNENKAQSYS